MSKGGHYRQMNKWDWVVMYYYHYHARACNGRRRLGRFLVRCGNWLLAQERTP